MSTKKVQKKVQKPKEVKKVSTSSYSTRPKISRTYENSNFSLAWEVPEKKDFKNNSSFMRYHNQSSFIIGDTKVAQQGSKKQAQRRIKTEQFNSKLPTYDPKLGNRSQIVFGDEKPDFSKKQASILSSPTRVPPGGKSQIIFG